MGASMPVPGHPAIGVCCQTECDKDEELCLTSYSYSTGDEGVKAAPCKVMAFPAMHEDSMDDPSCPGLGQIGKDHLPSLLTGNWVDCGMHECNGDGDTCVVKDQSGDDSVEDLSDRVGLDYAPNDMGARLAVVRSIPARSDLDVETTAPAYTDGVPLLDSVEKLSAELVADLLKTHKCRLVDVRGADRCVGLIDGAMHVPAISVDAPYTARLPDLVNEWKNDRLIIFFCQFCKHRAPYCANLYRDQCDSMQRVAIIEGGFRAWQSKGLPVQDGGGTIAERATADAFALHQGTILLSRGTTTTVCQGRSTTTTVGLCGGTTTSVGQGRGTTTAVGAPPSSTRR